MFFRTSKKDSPSVDGLATDFVHTGSAYWAFAFHSGFAVFHGDFNGCRIFALGATFYTIHACHFFIHLLST